MATKYHSFKSLIEEYNGGVEIPVLQRDYAQGRSNRQNIRSEFLDKLIDCLKKGKAEENSTLVLDFIYGFCESNKFIPLDGQQRLTTLFLLHYYLFPSEVKENFFSRKHILSYKTRLSSQKFCDTIMTFSSNLKRNGQFVDQIKDSSWFSNSWMKDPTINGMLVMLNAIDKHLHSEKLEKYWSRLTDDKCIMFLIKDINDEDNYVAHDNLYIKMNARGKLLSEYENFKSYIDGAAKNYKNEFSDDISIQEKENNFYEHWIDKIDHKWTDLFWVYRNKNDKNPEDIGDEFMRFFKAMLYDKLVLNGVENFINSINESLIQDDRIADDSIKSFFNLYIKDEDKKAQGTRIYNELLKKLSSDELIYNLIYKKLNLFDDAFLKRLKIVLDGLTDKLDLILNETKDLNLNIESQRIDNEKSFERNIFQGIITGKVTFQNRLLFYSLVEIILNKVELDETFHKLRVVRNLIENRQYNNVNEYREGLIEISKIILYNNTLESLSDDTNSIAHFDKDQIEEERNKARILNSKVGNKWRDPIKNAENHDYLMGQISFLLSFANIEDFNTPSDENLELFEKYFDLSTKVFEYNKDNYKDFLIQRSLLCFGDYLLEFSGKRKGLLTTNKERDTTLKKLLIHENKTYFRKLLDKLSPENNIEKDLNMIVNKESGFITDWRHKLINNEFLIKNIGNYKLIEFSDDEKNVIYLITGNNNGYYFVELKTFDIFQRISNNLIDLNIENKLWEIKYHHSQDQKFPPCFVLNQKDSKEGIAIEIHFENYEIKGLKYRISVFCRNLIDNEGMSFLQSILEDKIIGFEWVENEQKGYYRFERFYNIETDCLNNLTVLVN